jgi:hypothetical protein
MLKKKSSHILSQQNQNDCDKYEAGIFGKCKSCGKQKRSHAETESLGDGSSTNHGDGTPQPPHPGTSETITASSRARKTSRAAAMKTNDTSKVAAVSVMRTCEPTIQGYLGKLPSGIGAIKRDYQERYFVLSAHYLAYYVGKPAALEDDPKGVYDVSSGRCSMCNQSTEDGTQDNLAEFEISFTHDNSVLKLRGRSAENSLLWVQHLSAASSREGGTESNQSHQLQPDPQQKKGKWSLPKMGNSKSSKCEVCKTSIYANDAQLKIDSTVLHKVLLQLTIPAFCEENPTA